MSKGRPRKFSLANVLALLSAVVFGLVCFSGRYFYDFGDNTPKNIAIAVVIILLLSVLAIGAGAFKRAGSNFAVSLMLEIIFLLAFTGLTIIVTYVPYSPLSQYFPISEQKMEKQHYSPFQQYFVVLGQTANIREAIDQTDLLGQEMEKIRLKKLDKWYLPLWPIGIFGVIYDIQQSSSKIEDVKKYFTTPDKPRLFSIATGAAILLYILMLTPYLTSKRSEKPTILKKNEENIYKRARDTKINLSAINS
jgi:hypothetical protein